VVSLSNHETLYYPIFGIASYNHPVSLCKILAISMGLVKLHQGSQRITVSLGLNLPRRASDKHEVSKAFWHLWHPAGEPLGEISWCPTSLPLAFLPLIPIFPNLVSLFSPSA
jgi:hypothetical protein